MPDTLAGASVENTMIYLRGFLIMNIWVICSVLHYKQCYYGHSPMCLPELICKRFS